MSIPIIAKLVIATWAIIILPIYAVIAETQAEVIGCIVAIIGVIAWIVYSVRKVAEDYDDVLDEY